MDMIAHLLKSDPQLNRIREQRTRIYERLDANRSSADSLFDILSNDPVNAVSILIRLEGLRMEQTQLLREYQAAEDGFITHMLERCSR